MSDDECTTWRQLRDRIDAMPVERIDDLIQILMSTNEDPVPLAYAFGFNTVGYYSTCADGSMVENHTRGVIDNEHHTEHFVLLADENPFDEDGNTCYEETPEGLIGNKTGRNYGPGIFSEGE